MRSISLVASSRPISKMVGATLAHLAASSAIGRSSLAAPANAATKAWRQAVLSRGPMPPRPCSAISQSTAVESKPPERQVPIGTSLRIRNATALRNSSPNRSTRSASVLGMSGK